MRGRSLRLAGQHHLRPLMLSMSMSVIAKSKLSFVYHCLLLLHLPLFLCGRQRPPAARFARRSSSHFLVLSCGQPGPVLAGRQEASYRLPSKPPMQMGYTPVPFCFSAPSPSAPAHFISSMRTVSLHRAEPSASPAPATTLQQPLLSVLVGRLMFASASAKGATRRPFALSAASFSGVAFLRSPFFFWFFLCVPFGGCCFAWCA